MREIKKVPTEDTTITVEEALDGVEVIELSQEYQKGGRMAPVDPVVKQKAFEMYLDHVSYDVICKELNLKKNTLSSWSSRENWKKIRKDNEDALLKDDLESKKYLLSQLSKEILENCLKGVRKAGGVDGFKPKELMLFLSSLGNIEKLSRLSLGLATSISEERSKRANFTMPLEQLKDVQQVKVSDPFAAIEEAKKDANGTADT